MREAGYPGSFIEISFVMTKKYQLMAWTEKGQVKMIPSLVSELAEPYVRKIQAIAQEPRAHDEDKEADRLIRHSRAHEALGRFFLRVGYWEDAFLQFAEAALTITNCPDELWNDAEVGFLLYTPLEHRFLAMYNRCRDMADEHPAIKGSVQWGKLLHEWHRVTEVHQIWRDEFREVTQTSKAWRFGRR